MRQITRAGLAGLWMLGPGGAALAQVATPDLPAAGTPTAAEPAATETPKTPAAAGGDASDATASGRPAGSAPASDASSPAAPAAPPGPAGAGTGVPLPRAGDTASQVKLIAGLCGVQMKAMTPESCQCLAEQSLTGLSDPQRDYLIATVVSPPVADRMLADGRVDQPDQQVIAAFIDRTSDACATGRFVAPAK